MPSSKSIAILSVPYCEPLPMVAPVLLSSCLQRHGIAAVGIDFNIGFIDHFINKEYWPKLKQIMTLGHLTKGGLGTGPLRELLTYTRSQIKNIVDRHDPRWIGLSLFTNESVPFFHVMCYVIKRWFPERLIMLGGRALELDYHGAALYHYIDQQGVADLIVIGDAETSIVDAVKKDLRGVYRSPSQTKDDLDQIPLPAWDDYDLDQYNDFSQTLSEEQKYFSVIGSKGCVRKCSFCDVASFWPRYIYRDGDAIAHEIIENYRRTGIKHFRFADNLMNGSIREYRRMNQVLAGEIPRQINYQGYAIFRSRSQLKPQDFNDMADAGCSSWIVGVESGSERVRKHMRKGFSNDDIDWTAGQLYLNGIRQSWLFMVGYPTETEDDFEQTRQLLRRYQHKTHDRMICIGITPPFNLLKNSPLWLDADLRREIDFEVDDKSFWRSMGYPDNTFAVRCQRWFELVDLIQDLGYQFHDGMPVDKWRQEVQLLQEKYVTSPRIIAINPQ